ncbi:hypothetical protein K9396_002433, partial [Salmonella enterica subsp. enterica serovar Typhimurium]|nr:hypothetical protein [Salmonella enterica subsp. enterica serovar Typhimurium]
ALEIKTAKWATGIDFRLARRTDGGEVNSSVAGVSALTTVIAGKTASEINVRIRNNVKK